MTYHDSDIIFDISKKNKMHTHITLAHKIKKSFRCEFSDHSFSVIWNLNDHDYSNHGEKKYFKCKIYDKMFAQKGFWNVSSIHQFMKK